MNVKRFLSSLKLRFSRNVFVKSSQLEKEVHLKLESLLPSEFKVKKASKYTESEEEFSEKLWEHPLDHFIFCKGIKVAAIEVTQGTPGYTVRNSRFIKISENKLAPFKRESVQGYVIVVVIEEPVSSKERYIWCTTQIIEESNGEEEYAGFGWKKWLYVYHVPIDKWKVGLKTFVSELIRLTD
jgi:hypothetical protein